MNNLKSHIFESLETYKDLFDCAHDLIHIVEIDGSIIYVNNAWQEVLGYSQEEIQGRSIYSFIHGENREAFIAYREKVIRNRTQDENIISVFTSKSGAKITLEGFVSARVVDGEALYTRGIFRDVTRRVFNESQLKLINSQLKESETSLYHLFYHAPDAIIVIDTNSIVTRWNPKAEVVFGWTATEVIGKSLTDLIIPERYREAHKVGMKRFLVTGEEHVLNRTIDITAINREGQEFFIALTISSTIQKDQRAFVAFIRDIDAQKRDAMELERKKMLLEQSNQALEQFAHVVSHDLKEPVRKVRMFSDQLRSAIATGSHAKVEDHLLKIEKAASRLTDMIEGILTYSSLKSQDLKIEVVDLSKIFHDVCSDLEVVVSQKHAVLRYSDLGSVEGSDFLLYQLFSNLINNALKFSRPDVPPVIEITSSVMTGHEVAQYLLSPLKRYVKIMVSDNGIGFHQNYVGQIFDAFARLHSRNEYEGTGLGLSLCKTIVEKHNGVIMAEGKENEGATFTILLPEKQS